MIMQKCPIKLSVWNPFNKRRVSATTFEAVVYRQASDGRRFIELGNFRFYVTMLQHGHGFLLTLDMHQFMGMFFPQWQLQKENNHHVEDQRKQSAGS